MLLALDLDLVRSALSGLDSIDFRQLAASDYHCTSDCNASLARRITCFQALNLFVEPVW